MTNNLDIILDQAFSAYNGNDFDRAESLCREVLSAQSGNGDALFLLGLIAYRAGALDPAADLLFQAVKLYPKVENYTLTLASVLYRQGHLREALTYYQKFPHHPRGLAEQGFIYLALGQSGQARKAFNEALSQSPHLPEAELGLALISGDKQTLKELAESSNLPDAWYHLARLYRSDAKYTAALKAIDKTGLKQSAYLLEKGLIYADKKQYDLALEMYHEAGLLTPHNPDILTNQANIYKLRGENAAAENYYKRALAQDGTYLPAMHNLADLLYHEGRFAESLEQYRTLLSHDPKNVSALFNLAILLEKTGEYADSLGLYFKVLLSDTPPQGIEWRIADTLAALAEKNHKLALDFATGWVKNFPDDPVATHTYAALSGKTEADISQYIEKLYDDFSYSYDAKMKELNSHTIAEMKKLIPHKMYDKALDIGCGTGAWGRTFRRYIGHLTGIDLSQKMLDLAHQTHAYNDLIQADGMTYLSQSQDQFDLITAIEILGYLPDIKPLFQSILPHLKPDGLFAFSVETTDRSRPTLGFHGRYLYPATYVTELLAKSGLHVIAQKSISLRREGQGESPGIIFLTTRETKD